jgi:lipid-A-disaccharide synthase
MGRLLVVAGEGSGDAFAAPVVARLGVSTFGLGGPHLARAGTELSFDLRSLAAMGLVAPLTRAPRLARAALAITRAAQRERPRAALLVGFSELNARLAGWLRARGTRVLWYAPPQVWAWRPGRARSLAARCDKLAVVLPFEVPVWRKAGASVEYVGHPALELSAARDARALPSERIRMALLPGSRPHEIRAHLGRMVGAALKVRERLNMAGITVVRAPALDQETARHVEETTRAHGMSVTDAPLPDAVLGHDVAIVASGTATLECAALAVPCVIVYRTDPLTYALAKHLVRVPHIGLPNLVLGKRAFPELIQGAATPDEIARSVIDIVARRPEYLAACDAVKRALESDLDGRSPSARVAEMLSPWMA